VRHGVSHNLLTVVQLFFQIEQRSVLCNLVARMLWTLIGQFLFMQSQSTDPSQWPGLTHPVFIHHWTPFTLVLRCCYINTTPFCCVKDYSMTLMFVHAWTVCPQDRINVDKNSPRHCTVIGPSVSHMLTSTQWQFSSLCIRIRSNTVVSGHCVKLMF